MYDVGIVFLNTNGKTKTRWYSEYIKSNNIFPMVGYMTIDNYASQTHINSLRVMSVHQPDEYPIAIVKVKK